MTTLTIHISDETAQRLKTMAEKSGLSLQDTVQIYLDDQAARLDVESFMTWLSDNVVPRSR